MLFYQPQGIIPILQKIKNEGPSLNRNSKSASGLGPKKPKAVLFLAVLPSCPTVKKSQHAILNAADLGSLQRRNSNIQVVANIYFMPSSHRNTSRVVSSVKYCFSSKQNPKPHCTRHSCSRYPGRGEQAEPLHLPYTSFFYHPTAMPTCSSHKPDAHHLPPQKYHSKNAFFLEGSIIITLLWSSINHCIGKVSLIYQQ